jgi:threonylcarbamoyladenosine tRNA methylthiotransferase MtaB
MRANPKPPVDSTPGAVLAGVAAPRVHASFVGCKVSQADSEAVLRSLVGGGCRPVDDPRQADVQILLTCGVTGEAERSSRQLARRLAAYGRPVVVAGCAAALRPDQFAGDGIVVAGGERVVAAAETVAECVAEVLGRQRVAFGACRIDDSSPPDAGRAFERADRTRFTLKAQDGCGGACSYCAVRLARGMPRSIAIDQAESLTRAALAAGCGEIVVSGVDVGAYRDPAQGGDLAVLVARLVALPGLARLRLSSLEPPHLTPDLLEALAHPRVARHLHVPLQSADDGVLRAMNRPYTWADFREGIAAARSALPGLAVTTDVIAGFPTEDDAAFERTMAAIAPPDGLFQRVHVFSYSPRAGTTAAALTPLPATVVKARARRAREAAAAALRAAAAASRHAPAQVLLEEYRDGFWRGYSSTYVRYYLTDETRRDGSADAARGRLAAAVGDELHRDGLRGRLVGG